jgi:hypothetical protein
MQPYAFDEEPWYKDARFLHVAAGVALAALGIVVAASYPRGMGHDLGIVLVGAGGGVAVSGVTTVHMLVHSFEALLGVLVGLQNTVRADIAPRFTRAFTLGSELVCYLRVSTDIRDKQHAQLLEAADAVGADVREAVARLAPAPGLPAEQDNAIAQGVYDLMEERMDDVARDGYLAGFHLMQFYLNYVSQDAPPPLLTRTANFAGLGVANGLGRVEPDERLGATLRENLSFLAGADRSRLGKHYLLLVIRYIQGAGRGFVLDHELHPEASELHGLLRRGSLQDDSYVAQIEAFYRSHPEREFQRA